jgi:Flp pilus assembly protein TadD
LTFATPYRNVRPDVRYVGDEACEGCHQDIAATFHRHPMGRSLTGMPEMAAGERYDEGVHDPFERFGQRFLVERRGEEVFHKETRADARGRSAAAVESEVAYAVGSGTLGRSYLVNHDGYVFQSPISWFTQAGRWDCSPGFDERLHFERPITPGCLFCHADSADLVEHTLNRYRVPFHMRAIGCERCHGPGELHVLRRGQGDDPAGLDDTIVNPARLEPALRESVCQQCHLEGEVRILPRGRQAFDYRPGLPLHLFWSVFVRRPELTQEHRVVGQVEQMEVSRCFQASDGQLGCISCHDPHVLPAREEKVAHYRGRCLSCHEQRGCQVPLAARRRQNGDDCSACHMPRLTSSDVAHTAVTDHRILRRPSDPGALSAPPLDPATNPLVYFHKSLGDPHGPEVERDMGLALVDLARQHGGDAQPLSAIALPYLEGAVHRVPDNVAAWEAKGFALWQNDQKPAALAAYEAALALAPERERSLTDAAELANQLGRRDTAIAYARRAAAVNSWVAAYHALLAQLLADRLDWQGALPECQAALRLNPYIRETRLLLVRCYLGKGNLDQARAELETLVALYPSDAEGLRRWFAEQAP